MMPGRISFLATLVALCDQVASISLVVISFLYHFMLGTINTLIRVEYKRVFKWNWWLLRNWWHVVVGNYEEVGRLLDFMDGLEEEKRKVTFLKPFQHLKPEELKLSRSIIDGIVNNLIHEAIDNSADLDGVNNSEIRNMEKTLEDKGILKKDDESGFFEEDSVSNTSSAM